LPGKKPLILFYLLGLIALSYFLFIFISNHFNPFIQTKAPLQKPRWHFGKAVALSSLAGGVIAVSLHDALLLDLTLALALYSLLTLLLIVPAALSYKKSTIWQ